MELLLTQTRSLKDKRSVLSRLKNQVRKKFNVSIAEIEHLDSWGRSRIGVTAISNDSTVVHQILSRVERLFENCFEIQVIERKVEMF